MHFDEMNENLDQQEKLIKERLDGVGKRAKECDEEEENPSWQAGGKKVFMVPWLRCLKLRRGHVSEL